MNMEDFEEELNKKPFSVSRRVFNETLLSKLVYNAFLNTEILKNQIELKYILQNRVNNDDLVEQELAERIKILSEATNVFLSEFIAQNHDKD